MPPMRSSPLNTLASDSNSHEMPPSSGCCSEIHPEQEWCGILRSPAFSYRKYFCLIFYTMFEQSLEQLGEQKCVRGTITSESFIVCAIRRHIVE